MNSFADFPVDRAKQFVAVNHEGYLIGDAILFHLGEDSFDLVGWFMVLDWVQYLGETGDYDVTFERDANSLMRTPGVDPTLYRYELQGPHALALMEKLTGAPVPPTRFFHMATFTIAGLEVRSLRHGMAGQPGFELFGPWAEGERVRSAILEAGAEFDLVLVGAKAYSSANLESAWVPSPLPAIFTGEGTAEYLKWLPANRAGSLAGSFRSDDIEDYYLTPYDLGYGRSVAFDHDFIGRAALEQHAAGAQRTKVTLVWNPEDVAAAQRSLYEPGTPAKYIDFPKARYGVYQVDRVLADGDGCRHLARRRLHHRRAGVRRRSRASMPRTPSRAPRWSWCGARTRSRASRRSSRTGRSRSAPPSTPRRTRRTRGRTTARTERRSRACECRRRSLSRRRAARRAPSARRSRTVAAVGGRFDKLSDRPRRSRPASAQRPDSAQRPARLSDRLRLSGAAGPASATRRSNQARVARVMSAG